MVTARDLEIAQLVSLFEAAAICAGYGQDTGRAFISDAVNDDFSKIMERASQLGADAEQRLARLMKEGSTPWVRYHAAILHMKTQKEIAMTTIGELCGEQGMFVPICKAMVSEEESKKSSSIH